MMIEDLRYRDGTTVSRLLSEHSAQLIGLAARWEAGQRRKFLSTYLWTCVTALFLVVATLFGLGSLVMSSCLAAAVFTSLVFMIYMREERRQSQLLEQYIELMAAKLERLIRKASQIEEHGKGEMISKVELDSILSEADGTLRFIERMVGLRIESSSRV